jgi:hypothetical protein
MPKVMCLYIDDSGTRNPDKIASEFIYGDWFTLGGFLMKEEDEGVIRTAYDKFREGWGITYPLRSYDIRLADNRFSWLRAIEAREYNRFMRELASLLVDIPTTGYACVIDRPGYNARYRKQYGRQTWMLCQTAFAVVCERAAKRARQAGYKLRVYVEEGDKTADDYIRRYYSDLRAEGMPFAADKSSKYAPLSAHELAETLYDLDFKKKTSPLVQLADLYLYPMARGGYQPDYKPYADLRAAKKLIDDHLDAESVPHLGIKYSCFELAIKTENKKSRKLSGSKSSRRNGDLPG